MTRLKFSLTSDQLELLLAFENAEGLNQLAETMGRDPSVVSRKLQRIAEEQPVLKKTKGRWEMTPLGIQINEQTKSYLKNQTELFSHVIANKKAQELALLVNAVLIIINAQKGLIDLTQEGRNNLEAEKNIIQVLKMWREKKRPIIHVKHVSNNAESPFYHHSAGSEFLDSIKPEANELLVEKTKSSAFTRTNLESHLVEGNFSNVILVGFTANECIDATAKDASSLGFTSFVVGDATATFDLRDSSGKLVKSERLHRLILANINSFYAKVINTSDIPLL
ncbi:MAG: isochorismatase family protein [Bdellovibrionales bacterium]|nr:isochorismatase family protein [Bdellovibrionales bacterium]